MAIMREIASEVTDPLAHSNQLFRYMWVNGKLVESHDAKVDALTHSLHYSGGVFEGEKAYNGKVFKLEEHTKRLLESAKTLRLEVPYSFEDIINAHYLLIEKNNIKDAYIRPLIWQGSESINLTHPIISVNLLIAAVPTNPRPATPLSLHLSRWRKPHPNSLPVQCKSSGHYNMLILCQKEAKSLGFDDAILLDWQDNVAECTTTNIFFVKNGHLHTPIADYFLNGITRQTIIGLAKGLNIDVSEERISVDQISKFDECFITGTAMEVREVKSIDIGGQNIVFAENKITNLFKQEYDTLVGK